MRTFWGAVALAFLVASGWLAMLWGLISLLGWKLNIVTSEVGALQAWIYLLQAFALVATLVYLAAQVASVREPIKAQAVMRLSEEWRDPELYRAVNYIHRLREEWKAQAVEQWDGLAKKWVEQHAPKNHESPGDKDLWREWLMRRTASQFLAKTGLMIESGYLTADVVFDVIPEMGRLLSVLIPIERAIQKYWTDKGQSRIAEWDRPFPKWEFNRLWEQYQAWFKKVDGKYDLNPIDWSKVSVPKVRERL
jgi:hypothetical protein